MKNFILALVLALMFSPQVFAARGVDYNGAGNPVTIAPSATGLKLETGKSIYNASGVAIVTSAGAVSTTGDIAAGSITASDGLAVDSGNVTITAGSLVVSAGDATVSGSVNAGAVNAASLGVSYDTGMAGSLSVGNGISVDSGSVTITAGNLSLAAGGITTSAGLTATGNVVANDITANGQLLTENGCIVRWGLGVQSGNVGVTAGNITITQGNMVVTDGDLTITDPTNKIAFGGVYFLTGSAATRSAVRADGGDAAPIGSVYFSTNGGATTAPKVYFKIANATADADWERLVTAASD